MKTTLDTFTSITSSLSRERLKEFLNNIAICTNWTYLSESLPKEFPNFVQITPQKILNDLNITIITPESRDFELITLFKRAVANYNALASKNEASLCAADPVRSYYVHHAPLSFTIPNIHLTLDVKDAEVEVTTELTVQRKSKDASLILDANNHAVLAVNVNGEKVVYKATLNEIIIYEIPVSETFHVTIKSKIDPFNNKSWAGMFFSKGILTTQCESEGARCIFPTIDRPDVLSKITTTIHACAFKYPCSLSNGNMVERTIQPNKVLTITWEDPIPKPSYLFACVLGKFDKVTDVFTTRSGKKVSLEVYVEPGKAAKVHYSLYALKKAMEFDETFFDREYELDSLKMAAIPNFRGGGAMENKGLIIFNETQILVDSASGTDSRFRGVSHTIAHEYFHNWRGNRVTIRNWFEIATKEAFTDLIAMLYTTWLFGEEYIRPKDVLRLWEEQFPEDASEKKAHPLVVPSFIKANSIFDNTTYIKGREVFRTLKNYLDFLVPDGFRKAQNHYFETYDGQAVTYKELLGSFSKILPPGQDLVKFERWFHQAGTPTVKVSLNYDLAAARASIKVTQSCLDPKTGKPQLPLAIPFSIELMGANGNILVDVCKYVLTEEQHEFGFDVNERPIPIVMHGYCAPVKLECDYTMDDLACLVKYSKDTFTRWNAGRRYTMLTLKILMEDNEKIEPFKLYSEALKNANLPPLTKVQLLQIPTIRSMSQELNCYDFKKLKELRSLFIRQLALACRDDLWKILGEIPEPINVNPNVPNAIDMQIRELRNLCFSLLAKIEPKALDLVFEKYAHENLFNNSMALFNILINSNSDKKEAASKDFYTKWKSTPAVFSHWLTAYASSETCTVAALRNLEMVEGFDPANANHRMSLARTFCVNLGCYHDDQGEGYKYIVDKILESKQTIIGGTAFIDFEQLPRPQQALMAAQLKRLTDPHVPEQIRDFAGGLLSAFAVKLIAEIFGGRESFEKLPQLYLDESCLTHQGDLKTPKVSEMTAPIMRIKDCRGRIGIAVCAKNKNDGQVIVQIFYQQATYSPVWLTSYPCITPVEGLLINNEGCLRTDVSAFLKLLVQNKFDQWDLYSIIPASN